MDGISLKTCQGKVRKMIKIPQYKPQNFVKANALRLFSKRYKIRSAIGREPEPIRRTFRSCLMTGDKKLLFVKNCKAGSTAISQLIVHYSTGAYSDDVHNHREGVYLGEKDYFDIRQGFDNKATYCFSMVRNPYDRLKSAYKNIFVDKKNTGVYSRNLPALSDRGYKIDGDVSHNFEVFVDFVDEALSEAPLDCNQHWREQHVSIGNALLPIDFIAKYENYNDDIIHVFNTAGLGDYISTIDLSQKYNPSSRVDLSISAAFKSKIEKIYAKDYEIFGY